MQTNRIDLIRPDAPLLARPGPYPVGVRTLTLTPTGTKDRPLVTELWYPAQPATGHNASYETLSRDGRTRLRLFGQALRDAEPAPAPAPAPLPLVILSHGYPGNRMLMGHLGENLASKGYLVASLDHPESTYDDPAFLSGQAFPSTLVNRPRDTRCVMDALGAKRVAIIGYSMGGYGALISGGAAVSEATLTMPRSGGPWMEAHRQAVADPRLKAIVPIGPWGRQYGVWDAAGMAGLSVPALIIAGSCDEVSGYDTGMRLIHAEAVSVRRHLLTFDGAGHNAAAPYPAPAESWAAVDWLPFVPFDHYADKVWDTVRMNNIAAHFITAFLDLHLKEDAAQEVFLSDAFAGFPEGAARGLRFETAAPGQAPATTVKAAG